MRKIAVISFILLSFSLSSCEELNDVVRVLESSIGQQPANAAKPGALGFNPTEDYPSRSTAYDQYLAPANGVEQWQLNSLFYLQFPQSESAIVSLLGYPVSEQENYQYWKIDGSSSEIAIYFNSGTAIDFTVGY